MNKEDLEQWKLPMNTDHYKNQLKWFDHSMLEEWRRCPRRFYYRHLRGLVPRGQGEASALRFGTLIHQALEILYHTKDVAQAVDSFVKDYDIQDDAKRSCSRGIEIVHTYYNVRRKFIEEHAVIDSEVVFEREFQAWHYRGKIDMVLVNINTKEIIGLDFKTNSWNISTAANSMEISRQFLGYQWYLKHTFPNVSDTFLVDIIQLNPKNTEFYLIPIRASKEFVDEFDAGVSCEGIAIMEACRWGVWSQSAPHACGVFNRTCEYHGLCSQLPSVRERLVEIEYEVKPWEVVIDEMKTASRMKTFNQKVEELYGQEANATS